MNSNKLISIAAVVAAFVAFFGFEIYTAPREREVEIRRESVAENDTENQREHVGVDEVEANLEIAGDRVATMDGISRETQVAISRFHSDWKSFDEAELEALIENAKDKSHLAIRLIGEGNGRTNYGRAYAVGRAMVKWPRDYIEAINETMRGENYGSNAQLYTNIHLESGEFDNVAIAQTEMKMGSYRSAIGRNLVIYELTNNSLESALRRIREMPIVYDQRQAMGKLSGEYYDREELANEESVQLVLEVAEEIGVYDKVRDRFSGYPTVKEWAPIDELDSR